MSGERNGLLVSDNEQVNQATACNGSNIETDVRKNLKQHLVTSPTTSIGQETRYHNTLFKNNVQRRKGKDLNPSSAERI